MTGFIPGSKDFTAMKTPLRHRSRDMNDRIHFGQAYACGYDLETPLKTRLTHKSGCHGWRDSVPIQSGFAGCSRLTTVVVDAAMKTPLRHRSDPEGSIHLTLEGARL